jgi:hypothetical protein
MAKLLAKEPLFNTMNELEQLDKVFDFCELSLLLIQLIFDDIMTEIFLFSYLDPYAHLMKKMTKIFKITRCQSILSDNCRCFCT